MSETTREIGPAIPYGAALASLQFDDVYISTESYDEKGEDFVQVEYLSKLYGPPRGPWYEMTVVNTVGMRWQLQVYLHRDRTERAIPNIAFVARP